MKKVFHYLQFVLHLLKLNAGTLLIFEILYKFTLAAVFRPLISGLIRLSMHLQGLSYLSDENFSTFVKSPVTWIFLLIVILGMAAFTLFDICCIINCFHASYWKQKIPLIALMRKSFQASLRLVTRGRVVMVLYLLIILPATHLAYVSGYMTTYDIPDFIREYIFSHVWLALAYVAFWVYIGWRSFHWLYSLHYFCLEKKNFKIARKCSFRLIDGHFWMDLAIMGGWTAALVGIYYGILALGAFLVTRINGALQNWDMFCSLSLSGVSVLLDVVGAIFYCFNLPLIFLGISILFYYYKRKRGEPIAPAFEDLDNAYRIMETRWAKKLYRHRKRVIALSMLVVLGINFFYHVADQKGIVKFGLSHKVEVTAHRGFSANYPENTIPAFKGAMEIGVDWIELDVQETADGEIIVMHDSNLKRTTGVDRNIWQVTYDEIKDLDNGSWFDPTFKEVTIPTLEEVLKVTRGRVRLNIEIKPTGHEKELEQRVVELVEKYHIAESCLISSMKYDTLVKIKQLNKEIQTVYITSLSYGNFNSLEYADGYSVESRMLSESFVRKAHQNGKKVYVWTVNTENRLGQVISMGVDNVITDQPVMAEKLIYEKSHSTFWDEYINRLLKLGS